MSLTETLARMLAAERKPKRVLLVEDDNSDAELAIDELKDWGYAVTHVKNGELALAEDRSDCDISIIDLCLPTMPGIEVAIRLSSKYNQMVIVICSGHIDAINALPQAMKHDFIIINKPFRISVLNRVGQCLNARQ